MIPQFPVLFDLLLQTRSWLSKVNFPRLNKRILLKLQYRFYQNTDS